jgi:hypothetical protein
LKGKTLTLPLTILLLTSFMVAAFVGTAMAASGTLALDPNSVSWQVGSEPAGLTFDVDVNITDVTDLKGIVFSVEWDPAYLTVTGTKWTAGTFLPAGPPDATGWMITWDVPAGQMKEAANSFMAGYGPISVPSGSWALVGTLHFQYIGAAPSAGSPVDTLINITKSPTAGMDTKWKDSSDFWYDFNFLVGDPVVDQCAFHYEAVVTAPYSPTANFVVTTPTPIYEGTTVDFNAASSMPGWDGDSVTPITEYWWSFEGEAAALGSVTPSHLYSTAGSYLAALYVVAPAVGWEDPAYVDTSATVYKTVSIKGAVAIGIDVYTEDYRWPDYTAVKDGTGEGEPADAFMPQENIDLYAYVYYNGDPVQNKLVEFDIWGPANPIGRFHFTRTAISSNGSVWSEDEGAWIPMPEGVAWIAFRVPWPCTDADVRVFGVWNITVKVALPDVKPGEETVYTDFVFFKVGYIVKIVDLWTYDVTGPADEFKKCETIGVAVDVTSIALGARNATLVVALYDDVGTCVAVGAIKFEVPGEDGWCNPQTIEVTVELHAPKWAYAGANAKVYANLYTDWPEVCGIPWSPEAAHHITLLPMT